MASATNAPPVEAAMLINGERIETPTRIEVMNPARPEERVGSIPHGTPEHVTRAIMYLVTDVDGVLSGQVTDIGLGASADNVA